MSGSNHFMQNGVLSHAANPVKKMLKRDFRNAIIISHLWCTAGEFQSPHLNLFDFWMWCYLKNISTSIAHLPELKEHTSQHIVDVKPETLRSVVEYAVPRFHLLPENGSRHVEYVLHQSRKTKNNMLMYAFYVVFGLWKIK